jgi:hypothetical protein
MNSNWFENLISGNGNGRRRDLASDLLENDRDFQDIDRMMYELGIQWNREDLNAETASMVQAFGGHINTSILSRILRGRGGTHRIVSPLADRIIELDGWAKLFLHAACLQADMSVISSYKNLMSSVRLDKFQKAIKFASDETQDLATRDLAAKRKSLFQNSQIMIENFASHALAMLMGSDND